MKMKSVALPTLGLLAAIATTVLATRFSESAWSAASAAPGVPDPKIRFVGAHEPMADWFNDQSGSKDYYTTSVLDETDEALAKEVAGLTLDSIDDGKNGFDFSDDASAVIGHNRLSSNLFGISPTAGWSGFSPTESFRRVIERQPGPARAGTYAASR